MAIASNMLLFIVISLLLTTVTSTNEQAPGCPLPSGPYVPPQCGENEYFEVCSFKCPPQTCSSLWSKLPCDPGDGCCRNECRCIEGHLRNDDGECVPTQDCYESNSQASASAASSSSASGGHASSSASASAHAEASGSSKGSCKPQKPSCIPTCAEPNPKNCNVDPKYVCKGGYILSKKNGGKCIRIEDCPHGDACPNNETFVNCKVPCPNDYCPVNDNQGTIVCDPPYPCPSGCICKLGYRRKSVEEPQCILAETCTPVNCTRQNEEWSGCPSACLAENCSDVDNQPSTCNPLVYNCSPRCICKKGYFRNEDRLCIPAEDCP